MTHDPDQLLYLLGERIDQLETAMEVQANADASLKHWEALQAVRMQSEGMSVAAAEKAVRAMPAWLEHYLEAENARVGVESLKNRIRLGHAHIEVWRSKNAQERRATQ